jgi:glutaminyl-peptide cyclotransferase
VVALVASALMATACNDTESSSGSGAGSIAQLEVEVVRRFPHDVGAFTQGLQLLDDGRVLESTGLRGASSLREVEMVNGDVVREHELERRYFAEGVAVVGRRAVQLTWQEQTAFVYDLETFAEIERWSYDGEGWGLCHDGQRFIMSDGTATLTFRDTETFEVLGTIGVVRGDDPVSELNELECVDGHVYANVYRTDKIVEIDPDSGAVVAEIDASGLLTDDEAAAADVLNGIAYDRATGNFLLTGKYWPTLFEVRFVESGSG